jgi:hypothetical protein
MGKQVRRPTWPKKKSVNTPKGRYIEIGGILAASDNRWCIFRALIKDVNRTTENQNTTK